MPDEPPVDCSGNPVGGGGGGNSGGGGGGASGCEPWLAGCVGFTGGGAPLTGEQAYGPGYSPVPDVHPVAASYSVAAQAGSVDGPGCNPMLFKYGACPSESGAAGTTPQEVRQSALGALGVLLGALPIGDLLDLAIGSAAEDSGLADAAVSCDGMSFAPGTKVLLASGIPQAKVGTGLVCGGCGQQSGLPFSRIRAVSGEEEEPVRRTRDRHRERVGIGFLHTWQKCSMFV